MPDRTRKGRPADANRRAWEIVQEATDEQGPKETPPLYDEVMEAVSEERRIREKAIREGKDPAAVLLGRKGGLKGGKARAAKLTPEERSEIARKAAISRWKKNLE